MKRLLVVGLLSLIASGVWAQDDAVTNAQVNRKGATFYDVSKVETLSGKVILVKEYSSRKGDLHVIGITVKTAVEDLRVVLGPTQFVKQQTLKIAAGDTVEITGVKRRYRGKYTFIAAEVKNGGQALKLRDKMSGRPLWMP